MTGDVRSLSEHLPSFTQSPEMLKIGRLIAYPHDWQLPAATEMAAYEGIKKRHTSLEFGPVNFEYVAFPWATLIDGVTRRSEKAWKILYALKQSALEEKPANRRVTVAQHIHAGRFISLFKKLNVTDIFWSHATHSLKSNIEGIRIHAFPLFPAQASEPKNLDAVTRPRLHLANFIGAFNPSIYLTNVREAIFDLAGTANDLLIIRRESWHFNRAVYDEQIGARPAQKQQILDEKTRTQEYLDAIVNSWFTLCPSGSGPNSIRIFESLALGSIPIVLTRDLKLAGPENLWTRAAIIEDDSVAGLDRAIQRARALDEPARKAMLEAGQVLFESIAPAAYGALICRTIEDW